MITSNKSMKADYTRKVKGGLLKGELTGGSTESSPIGEALKRKREKLAIMKIDTPLDNLKEK